MRSKKERESDPDGRRIDEPNSNNGCMGRVVPDDESTSPIGSSARVNQLPRASRGKWDELYGNRPVSFFIGE